MAQTLGIGEIRGVTAAQATKLRSHKITNSDILLERAATAQKRKELASASGLSEKDVLEMANRADLARVNGIGKQYGNLLENAGVDTIPELAQRRADNLHAKLVEAAAKSGVKRPPTMKQVEDWIGQAKALPRKLNY
jgi:predicted flap endonuclease-1-like 5' DNA nuclease